MPTFQFFYGSQKVHTLQGANPDGLKAAVDTLKKAASGTTAEAGEQAAAPAAGGAAAAAAAAATAEDALE
jgi:hypothetical protein